MKINTIYQGHTPDILKTFPDDSIDCVITSPPYWSLRDYKLEPQIWDGEKDCKHKWKTINRSDCRGDGHYTGKTRWQHIAKEAQEKDCQVREIEKGAWEKGGFNSDFCTLCGAWRGSLGLEPTFELYLKHLIQIFDEVKRVLKPTGTCFINIGDCYAGSGKGIGTDRTKCKEVFSDVDISETNWNIVNVPRKSLCAIPERFKIMMIDRGWICRNTIIWYKRNCMPSSANDRFTVDFEYVYFFVKSNKTQYWTNEKTLKITNKQPKGIKGIEGKDWDWDNEKSKKISHWSGHDYWFEQQFEPSIYPNDNRKARVNPLTAKDHKSGGNKIAAGDKVYPNRNKRCVWDVTTQPYSEAHFATFPEKLVEPMIRAGCPKYICKKCGKAREKIFKEIEGKKYTEEGNPEGINSSKMKWNDSHPTKNPRFWSDPTVIGITDCGCNAGWEAGIVLDPFLGSGTVAKVTKRLKRNWVGIELNPEYIKMAEKRIKHVQMELL